MALVLKDRVKETTVTVGTITLVLAGAASGFQSFSAIGNGNTTYYAIDGGAEWEVGIGTYTLVGTTLSRDTILSSSNGGTAVNFSAGTKSVFVTYPAGKGIYTDASGNAIALGTPASATLTNATGLPISTGVSGLGTNVATALGTAVGSAGAIVTNGGALGTPTSGTLTNCTGLPATGGGTGQSTYAVGDLLQGAATNTLSKLTAVATGNALISGGVTTASSWGKIGLTTHVSGTLPIANGGTNLTAYTTGDIVYASATNVLSSLADVATGNALISGGVGAVPSYGKIGLTTHVTGTLPVANGGTNASAASITAFNNITGYTASGATGTTSTNLVFSTAPTFTTTIDGGATFGAFGSSTALTIGYTGTGAASTTNISTAALTGSFTKTINIGTNGTTGSTTAINIGTSVGSTTTITGTVSLGTALPIASGGTNSTATATAGGAGYGTGTAHAYTAAGTSGQPLISAGASAPAFGTLALGTANTNVSGTLTVTNGGTGAATLTANNVLLGNGTSALQVVAPSTSGNVLTSNGTTWSSSASSSVTTLASNVSVGTGTSFTISSLTLTSYKFLGISLVGAAGGATNNFISTAGTPATGNAIFLVGASSSRWQYGILDLTAQTALGTGGGMSQATGVTTASTSITFTCNNAFTAGTYYLYGIK